MNTVRPKAQPVRRRTFGSVRTGLIAGLLVVTGVGGVFGYDFYSGSFGLIGPQFEIAEGQSGRIIKVPPGGNLQGAIDAAKGGDIVELQAGAVYNGQINLPNKPITEFVTIQSSAVANLPADKRVSPANRSAMATIVAGMLGRAAVSAANGAHHYRFVGIEFTTSSTFFNYGLVRFGSEETRPENVPHHLEIDRAYIHSNPNGKTRRGIALNSADTVIKNSYIEGFAYPGEETQGICGWTGTRNVLITNNYVEGGAENIMFGGSDIASAELIPSHIEVRGNHLNKPAAWKGQASLKNLFQLKNAKHVKVIGNLMTNNWVGAAFRITVRNETGGSPYSTIEDVVISDNVIDTAGDGVNILGTDNNFPSQVLKRLEITNNLFLNIGAESCDGSGYFIQATDGEGILIANNTSFNTGNIATFYGTMPRGFVFRENIAGHGAYGVHGFFDLRSAQAQAAFQRNVFVNNKNVPDSDYAFPPGNTIVDSCASIGFLDAPRKDYRLAGTSRFKGKAADKSDVGARLNAPNLTALVSN